MSTAEEIAETKRYMRQLEAQMIRDIQENSDEFWNTEDAFEHLMTRDSSMFRYIYAATAAARSMAQNPDGYAIYQVFDDTGDLLYIGVTSNIGERMLTHFGLSQKYERQNKWAEEAYEILIFPMPSKLVAEATEKELIRRRNPKYNIAHNGGNASNNVSVNGRRRLPPLQQGSR